jgi:signal transduction histidine kinase
MGEAIWGRRWPIDVGGRLLALFDDGAREDQMTQPKTSNSIIGFDDMGGRLDPLRYITKVNRVAAVVGLVFFTLAVFCAWLLFRPYVPHTSMQIWLWGSCSFLFSWLVIDIVLIARNPSDPELVGFWEKMADYVRAVTNLIVLATIWLFLPVSPYALQLAMTIFYVAHVPTQILTMPGRGPVNAIGAAIILGSVAICTLLNGGEYATLIAIFVSAYALVMIILALVVSRLIGNTMSQRLQSDITTLKLEDALAAVAQERDAKTRFMAAASHDLGQPLQAASLYFDQTLMARNPSQRTNAIEGVRKAFDATEQLLAHMLNHLRLDADAVEPQFSRIKLPALFQSLAKQFKPLADKAGIDIRAFAGGLEVYSDKVLLERALGNLINNAIHHSQGTRVLLVGRPLPNFGLRLWVLDDGRGVKADDAPLIFSDYYRGSQAGGLGVVGFGLGLSSVKRIAHLLGGEAGLEARWKAGAAFYIDLAPGAVLRGRGIDQQRKPS